MGGIISALVVQKKNKNRVNVYLDGEFAFGLTAIEALKLRRGQALTDAEIAALQASDEVERARQHALGLLERRPRSQVEIQRYLNDKGYSPKAVEKVLARLTEVGLLDDRAFARYWLENRANFRPRGARALRYELRQKGVPAEVIDELLAGDHDEEQAAFQAAMARARKWQVLDTLALKKLESFLIRRGFSYQLARDTTRRVWQQLSASDIDPLDEFEIE